jgi:hypothetical protein
MEFCSGFQNLTFAATWMNHEDIMQSKIKTSHRRTSMAWSYLSKIYKIVKFTEAETRMVVAGPGGGRVFNFKCESEPVEKSWSTLWGSLVSMARLPVFTNSLICAYTKLGCYPSSETGRQRLCFFCNYISKESLLGAWE